MTRSLSRIWNDPLCSTLNEETERLFAYHHATKHTYESVRTDAHFLDWRNQPNPFRIYEGAPNITLPPNPGFPDIGTFGAIAALMEETSEDAGKVSKNWSGDGEETQLDLMWLSRLLCHSMAISAWKKSPVLGTAIVCGSTPRQEISIQQKHTSHCADSRTSAMACITIGRILTRSNFVVLAMRRGSLPGPCGFHGLRNHNSLLV